MFLEPYLDQQSQTGWIELVCGCMFSGKTEELLRRIRRVEIARQPAKIFKPKMDIRYAKAEVVSHNQTAMQAIPVRVSGEILEQAKGCQVIGIDEAQFFDTELPSVVNQLAHQGIRVIISGLDMDFEGKPFGVMPELMAIADFVTKVKAVCTRCGSPASFSFRLHQSEQQVLLGEKESYEPLCRRCFQQAMQKRHNLQ